MLPNVTHRCKQHLCRNTILTCKHYLVPFWHENIQLHFFFSLNAVHRKWLTFQHLLQTVPHDVDVLYPDELELDVGIIVFILVAFPGSTVCHGVKLQQSATQNSHP